MGMPAEQGLRTASVAVRVGQLSGATEAECRDALYLALLRYVGCTADSDISADVMGDEVAVRGALYGVDWGAPGELLPRIKATARGKRGRRRRSESLPRGAPRQQARPEAIGWKPHFDLGLRLSTGPGALGQVSVDAVAVAQRVGDEGVCRGEIDRRITLHDLFRYSAQSEGRHNRIQCDARAGGRGSPLRVEPCGSDNDRLQPQNAIFQEATDGYCQRLRGGTPAVAIHPSRSAWWFARAWGHGGRPRTSAGRC